MRCAPPLAPLSLALRVADVFQLGDSANKDTGILVYELAVRFQKKNASRLTPHTDLIMGHLKSDLVLFICPNRSHIHRSGGIAKKIQLDGTPRLLLFLLLAHNPSAACDYLQKGGDLAGLDAAAGVGVSVTREEVAAAVGQAIAAHKSDIETKRYRFTPGILFGSEA